ncbi:hypothetical protein TNIN_183941 [Trichonephila inaurata madagascariensis]|uniref:Uncharacterized protein n=1 Tax=Trichonephila inaurata madagascariensis TaxID=2747483 RepID=A0A8X7BR26_9ARAC|nr:hypothetical protein TNIN_183941 [Trichonephila inaurata madagascariensis]
MEETVDSDLGILELKQKLILSKAYIEDEEFFRDVLAITIQDIMGIEYYRKEKELYSEKEDYRKEKELYSEKEEDYRKKEEYKEEYIEKGRSKVKK